MTPKGDVPLVKPSAAATAGTVGANEEENPAISHFINAKVTVYASLSGMVSFLPNGNIHGCNHHFALMLFGYSEEQLLKQVCIICTYVYVLQGL